MTLGDRRLPRQVITFLHDLTMAGLSFVVALALRLGVDAFEYVNQDLVLALVIFTLVCGAVFRVVGLYRGIWRYASLNDLVAILTGIFKRHPASDWLERLEGAGVPAGPVLDIAGMQADAQAVARGMVMQVPHSRVGPVKTLGHPVHYSATPTEITRGAPLLGEHTREILAQHGYSLGEVDKFLAEGVVVAENP